MTDGTSFAARIRERYPEGLTGILAVGATRTTYILDQNRQGADPGHIHDFATYADYAIERLMGLITLFFDLGGQNVIVPMFSYQGFYERGEEYGSLAAKGCLKLIDDGILALYREHQIDPYFVGIDTLLHLPADQLAHQIGAELDSVNKSWPYQAERRRLIWEVAPIPLLSFWRAEAVMGQEARAALQKELAAATDLRTMHDLLYRYYARAVYGTDIPMPHFYLGTNRNGDIKLRAMLPISLICGGPFRLFYTPYPPLYITRQTFQAILEDLAFGKRLRSTTTDYSGSYTPELAEAEYQRILKLSADPASIVGLLRQVSTPDNR
jgi:hypothetical protein